MSALILKEGLRMNSELLGNRIQQLREAKGLTQEELAAQTGISIKHISVLERGVKTPRLATFITIAEALGVTPNDLLADPAAESNYPRALQEKIAPLPIEKQEKIFKIVCALCDDL